MTNSVTPEQNFERVLLSSLLKNREIFSKCFTILKTKYFKQERSDIFKLIKQHYSNYNTCPTIQDIEISVRDVPNQDTRDKIFQELQQIQKIEQVADVAKMQDQTVKFVKDSLYLEALEIGSEGLLNKDDNLKLKAEKILDERAKVTIDSDVGIEFSDVDAVLDYYSQETRGLLTQHYSINERLGPGFLPGTLSIILAASGVGKSLLMTDLISGYVKDGKNVLLVSLEMSQEEVMKRVHSNVLEIPIGDFQPGKFDKKLFIDKLQKKRQQGCGVFYTKDYPAQSFSALQLENLVETYKNEKNLEFDIIFVDYLGIMKSDKVNPAVGLYSYVKSIAEEVRATAKKLNVAILSANQLNRSATNNTNSDNANVSDSYGTVMTADFMMFLLQTEEMKENGDIIAKITKNRFSGRTETFPMRVDYTLMKFEDPGLPESMEARSELREQFEFNVKEVDKLIHEDHQQNVKNANIHDAKNAQGFQATQTTDEFVSLSDTLNSLLDI